MKLRYITFSIACLLLLVSPSLATERFILRSFSAWEDAVPELGPVFRHLQNPEPNWAQVHETAIHLSREAASDSFKAQIGVYFTLLAERALQTNSAPSELEDKIRTLQSIQEFIHTQVETPPGLQNDMGNTLQFEIAFMTFLAGEDEKAIKMLTDLLSEYPSDPIAPDAARLFAALMLIRKDYNRGISFLERLARKSDDFPELRFEAFYRCSILETQVIQKSPKALWYCHQAVESVTEPDLQKRAQDRLIQLRELQKQEL
ncbi:MAG: hypothetical protein RBU29_07660 [bacterium]|jgi:hypothetical protein|nr:hypothetical protein [bacterium]